MSYGLSGAEKKPLFGGSSSSSSNPPQDGPNAFPGQESLGAVQQQHQQQGAPQRTGQCCDCFSKCSTNCARRLLDGLGALNGLLIIMVGVTTGIGWVHNCPTCGCSGSGTGTCANSCCYCVWTDVILPCYTVFLGGILFLAELRLPIVHRRCKDSCGFMFSLTWRALYLAFIGSFGFAIKCADYQWVGYGAGVYTLLNVMFSCWVMNKHPGFLTLTGHEEYAETSERALQVKNHTNFQDSSRGTAMNMHAGGTFGSSSGGGGGGGYAPPSGPASSHPFNAPDPYASSSNAAAEPVNEIFPEQSFDANPFA